MIVRQEILGHKTRGGGTQLMILQTVLQGEELTSLYCLTKALTSEELLDFIWNDYQSFRAMNGPH